LKAQQRELTLAQTPPPPTPKSIQTWAYIHFNNLFYFQNGDEVNAVQVPFNIGIQTLMQLQSMFSFSHNGAISLDVTFGTNNVKFELFMLMVFNVHCTRMLIIRSSQVDKHVND
jgi:hypothetical protein